MAAAPHGGRMAPYLTTIAIYDAISVAEARSTGSHQPFRFCSLQHSGFAFTATEPRGQSPRGAVCHNKRHPISRATDSGGSPFANAGGTERRGDKAPRECPRIFTNSHELIRIREIRVNSWTVTSVWAHLALGHLEDRGRWRSAFVTRREAGKGFASPAGRVRGRRRRRLSWSRPQAALWQRAGRFARTRNGAVRRSRKPACAEHESVRAGRRDTKTLRPTLESQLAVAKGAHSRIITNSRRSGAEEEFRARASFRERAWRRSRLRGLCLLGRGSRGSSPSR